MSATSGERVARLVGLALGAACAAGSVVRDGDLELVLFMAASVIGALACFDAGLDRRADAFWTWLLASIAILVKAIPTVIYRLSPGSNAMNEGLVHLGSLLAATAIALAAFLLARPPAGAERRVSISLVVLASWGVGAVAATSVAFAGQASYLSESTSRILEAGQWGGAGAIIAAVSIAAAVVRRLPLSFVPMAAGALGVAALVAMSAAGSNPDLGLWAVVFMVLALTPLAFPIAELGATSGRRESLVPTIVAVLAAVAAVQGAVLAAGADGTWAPGVFVLPVLALMLFGLAVQLFQWGAGEDIQPESSAARPFDFVDDAAGAIDMLPSVQGRGMTASLPALPLRASGPAASAFSGALGTTPPGKSPSPTPTPASRGMGEQMPWPPSVDALDTDLRRSKQPVEVLAPVATAAPVAPQAPVGQPAPIAPAAPMAPAAPIAPAAPMTSPAPDRPMSPAAPAIPAAPGTPIATQAPWASTTPMSAPAPAPPPALDAPQAPTAPVGAHAPAAPQVSADPRAGQRSFSAFASNPRPPQRAAAKPSTSQPRLAPHLVDPATGLRSHAGLQVLLDEAFKTKPQSGDVSLVMVALRDPDQIELDIGRVAGARVTAELANRFASRLPDAMSARFSKHAFAAIFNRGGSDSQALTDLCVDVLSDMLEPVDGGGTLIDVAVAASVAQCYEGEQMAAFVTRANTGLQRALAADDSSLVVMP